MSKNYFVSNSINTCFFLICVYKSKMTSNKNEEKISFSKINIKVTAKHHCFDSLMETMNTKAQLSLHSEIEIKDLI